MKPPDFAQTGIKIVFENLEMSFSSHEILELFEPFLKELLVQEASREFFMCSHLFRKD